MQLQTPTHQEWELHLDPQDPERTTSDKGEQQAERES